MRPEHLSTLGKTLKKGWEGIPAVAQCVKNPTAAVWVTVEAQVQAAAQRCGLQDAKLLQLQCRLDSIPGP